MFVIFFKDTFKNLPYLYSFHTDLEHVTGRDELRVWVSDQKDGFWKFNEPDPQTLIKAWNRRVRRNDSVSIDIRVFQNVGTPKKSICWIIDTLVCSYIPVILSEEKVIILFQT